ncbi:MAG: thioredoxin [Bacteroidota bacterium]|nr:thioredoxin [Bacteroidota bacterium]
MKKINAALISLLITTAMMAQNDSIQPPYKKFPIYPPVKLLLPDNTSYFSKADLDKKSPVMLMLFNPQCEHCQHETEALTTHIENFKHIQIIMATSMPFDSMMAFRERYHLEKYKNIVVGQDTHYFLSTFFMIRSLPFLAFYNKKKELISVFEGGMPMHLILKEFEK